jgi:dipeptidyl aminopeptidase/acylaminoacyl peptidase
MKNHKIIFALLFLLISIISCKTPNGFQTASPPSMDNKTFSPDLLWSLNRLTALGLSKDGKTIIYKISKPNIDNNNFDAKFFQMSLDGKTITEITNYKPLLPNKSLSPDGTKTLFSKKVYLDKILGSDLYPEMKLSDVKVYNSLDYRHWDTWEDGGYSHVFYRYLDNKSVEVDIMEREKFHCPQKPFGGSEDYLWHPDGNKIIYVSKKYTGTEYALTTNTDIYEYDLNTQKTINLTAGMKGYDTEPAFSVIKEMAWLSMKTDGYEADKNDIYILRNGTKYNLTKNWDGTVNHFKWSNDGKFIYFTAPIDGEIQLFRVETSEVNRPNVTQITNGFFDITSIITEVGENIYVTRTDMNTAAEIFSVDIRSGSMTQLTKVNDEIYSNINKSDIKKERITTTDGKKMVNWVIYPPNFDPSKKYPTLLYCQGGPQSALSQFYSYRWNFQLMAAQGYIVVAPNRRGMPGHGVRWNEEISKDWGGQVMRDYLSAIDEFSKNDFVDKNRIGAIGASYGGYSVFYLAGIHGNRFKTFISHCGVFNLQSMYGTTEEIFFTNYDIGGAYWESDNTVAQKTFMEFNPINLVQNWNTPILIIQGGKDYRVPIGQGQEAFQAAQLRGIKSRFLYFPEENHWVLSPQNGIIWQREFFGWLRETL